MTVTRETVFDAVPKTGAEIALAVFRMMTGEHLDPEEAMARAILGYQEWLRMQDHQTQLCAALGTGKLLKEVAKARLRYKEKLSYEETDQDDGRRRRRTLGIFPVGKQEERPSTEADV